MSSIHIFLVICLMAAGSLSSKSNQIESDHRMPDLWDPGDMTNEADVDFNFDFSDDYENSVEKVAAKKGCKTCQNGVKMSEEELTALRIEFVKNQILKKLRLTERPTVSVEDLPRPVTEHLLPMPEVDNKNRQSEDYYAKTTKKFIFLQEASEQCVGLDVNEPHTCLKFQIPADVEKEDVHSATLWVYKRADPIESISHTFEVSDVTHWDKERHFFKAKPIAITNTEIYEGWIKIDITWPITNWFEFHELTHVISVACKTCAADPRHSPVCLKHKRKPFIVIDTYAQRKHSRQKRNINCSSGTTECCREKLYISFAEIGWDDWILFPKGYDAYFCRGSCTSAASVTLSAAHHANVIRKVLFNKKQNGHGGGKQLELIPCCTATQFSSLQLFYMDSNNTATQKTLPNMIVSSCGCM